MDSINNAIKLLVNKILDEASKKVAKRFDVSIDDAMDIWKDLHFELDSISVSPTSTTKPKTTAKSTKTTPPAKKRTKKVVSDDECDDCGDDDCDEDKPEGCVHILTRGPNEGGECGKKISNKSQTSTYCSVHLNQENKVKPVKKDVKKSSKTESKEDNTVQIKIRLDSDYGRYVQSGTGLVFKSAQEKIVIGVQDEHGDLLKLSQKDIDNCKRYRFVYDESCVEKNPVTNTKTVEICDEKDEETD